MNNRMKKGFFIAKEIISWVLLIAVLCAFVFTVYNTFFTEKDSEGTFLLGYRPVLVLTGSMEPYMMTNGLALTKEVTDISQLEVGDVITYHVNGSDGKLLRITHRIIEISGEYIFTKGDNNNVTDGFALTMDNVEAKVIAVVNFTSWIAAKWQTTSGKIMLISFAIGAILVYCLIRMGIRMLLDKRNGAEDQAADENVVEADSAPEAPAETIDAPEPQPEAEDPEKEEPQN